MAEKCSKCDKIRQSDADGIMLWTTWYCSQCFIGQATELHREITPADRDLLKVIAREIEGLLPGQLLEMILTGFHRKATGRDEPPPRAAVLGTVGELQRLTAFAYCQKELRLLQSLGGTFADFVREREREIQEMVRKLTYGDE